MVTEQHAAGALDGSVDPEELTTLLAQENQALLVTLAQLKAENSALKATQPAAGEPKGWRLVPVEPLLGMMSDKDHETRISSERKLLAMLDKAPPAAAHGDEAVAVVGTVPDGSGFKSLDFKVDLQDLPDGTKLYARRSQGDGEVQ
ncbi:hypothetical protein NS337_03620 [Pseudomonas oryzihabitans]|uniref:hypothetical protein n=1 Tax=Pseudomonas oryzihabitans TaxID=47885 RepID=UPI0007375FC5|nr:hypothetical protein [Pseudomonas psychrotolerans]KTT56432.1 hypothetical protein NS337_03620 [Pseudomonas psychrotolerans]